MMMMTMIMMMEIYTYIPNLAFLLLVVLLGRTPFRKYLITTEGAYLPTDPPLFLPLLKFYSRTFALEQVAVLALDCCLIE